MSRKPQNRNLRKSMTITVTLFVLLLLIASIAGIATGFGLKQPEPAAKTGKDALIVDESGGRVCSMFPFNGSLYYADFKNSLFKYDAASDKGALVSKLELRSGSPVLSEKDTIYYSDESAIYKRQVGEDKSERLVSRKYISVLTVDSGRLFYEISFKDPTGDGFSEFEIHIYDTNSGKDSALLKRSPDQWHLRAVSGNTAIADATIGDESGIYSIDLTTQKTKKLSDLQSVDGCIIDGKYWFTSYDEAGLRSMDIGSGEVKETTLPGKEAEDFFIDRVTSSNGILYYAAYYNAGNHLGSYNPAADKAEELAEVPGRVWNLCADDHTLYSYSTQSPADKQGNIKVVPLK